jgi:hypothetical protein
MVEPGGEVVIHLVQAEGAADECSDSDDGRPASPQWRGTERVAEARWRAMFTPGNDHFSGHFHPRTDGTSVARLYYASP